MARTDRRNRQLTKRKPQKKVMFLVEGPTEKYYLHDLLKSVNYVDRIDIEVVAGGGYSSFLHYFQKNEKVIDICAIVADLDRAANNHAEKRILAQLITYVEKANEENIFFLTKDNLETWLQATLPTKIKFKQLGIMKADRFVFTKLQSSGASIELGERFFDSKPKLYTKANFNQKAKVEFEHLQRQQSNLAELRDFLKFHDKLLQE